MIGFLTGPIGRWLVIGVAFLSWTAYQRDQAADRARNECQAEQLQQTITELTRQRDAAQEARRAAENQTVKREAELEELESTLAQTISELEEVAGQSCSIPSGTIERLRNIK